MFNNILIINISDKNYPFDKNFPFWKLAINNITLRIRGSSIRSCNFNFNSINQTSFPHIIKVQIEENSKHNNYTKIILKNVDNYLNLNMIK